MTSLPTRLSGRRLSFGLDRFSGLYIWVIFIFVFGVWKTSLFLSTATLHLVADEQAVPAMLALAVLIPLTCGLYDLSVGATVNLGAVLAIKLQTANHFNLWAASLCAVLVCALIGFINGFIVVRLRVSSFITTLGAATVIAAVQTIVSDNNQPIPPTSSTWTQLTQKTVGGFQLVFIYLIILTLLVWWVLAHTPVGRYFYAIGGNPDAARLSGVKVGRLSWVSLVASATICGLAGVFYGSLNGPSLTFGPALLLPAFAAVLLGSTQLFPGRFNTWGTLIAVYVLATGVEGLQLVTGVQWLNDMFNGVALLSAASFAAWRSTGKRRARRQSGTGSSTPLEERPDLRPPSLIESSTLDQNELTSMHPLTDRNG